MRSGPDGAAQLDGEFVGALMKAGRLFRGGPPASGSVRRRLRLPGPPIPPRMRPPARAAGPNDLLPADTACYLEVGRPRGQGGWERCSQKKLNPTLCTQSQIEVSVGSL